MVSTGKNSMCIGKNVCSAVVWYTINTFKSTLFALSFVTDLSVFRYVPCPCTVGESINYFSLFGRQFVTAYENDFSVF